jgi:DNA-binding SARP family transcriptional activator
VSGARGAAATVGRAPMGAPSAVPAGSVRLELLRGFAMRHGSHILEVPLVVQRVVAFLALQHRPVHRLVVSGTLWMESGEDHASASLRTALWRLHRIVEDLVMPSGSTLCLAADVGVDVRDAERRAELLLRSPEEWCRRDLLVLGSDGDVLPDWYEDWVIAARERYRQLRLHALEALCRALAEAGAHAEAVNAGLAAVAGEPLRESSRRALMAAHLAQGNVCEALREYELFRRQLSDAVGLEPSERMQMMVARLRSQ